VDGIIKSLESPDLVEDLLIRLKYHIRYSVAGSKFWASIVNQILFLSLRDFRSSKLIFYLQTLIESNASLERV
jgi:hypothetical protein